MQIDEVNGDLATIMSNTRAQIDALAAKVRETIVVPICRKHKLRYLAGMGRTIFVGTGHRSEDTIGSAAEARDDYGGRYAYLAEVFEKAIDLEVDRVQVLGYFIDDVD